MTLITILPCSWAKQTISASPSVQNVRLFSSSATHLCPTAVSACVTIIFSKLTRKMNKQLIYALTVYFVLISAVTAIVTVIDKRRAIKQGRRTPESTLLLLGLFGGALSEYIVMKKIHHKTLHKKFMIGLPLIMLLHMAIIIFCIVKFI